MLHHIMLARRARRRNSSALVTLAVVCLVATACSARAASPSAQPPLDATSLTAYDPSAALGLAEDPVVQTTDDGIRIHDVAWDSPGGGRVSAWLVIPAGSGPFAGIVYLHGSETNRDDFLDEAVAMAHGGAASLVLDAPFSRSGASRHGFLADWGRPELERDMTAQAVVDVRRAYDVLLERGDVDSSRLAYVGHSWGASLGVVLAAVDDRPGSLALITGRPSWTGFLRAETEEWVRSAHQAFGEEKWQHYLELMATLDAMAEIDRVDARRLYLQYGSEDDVVPPQVAAELIDAAEGAKSDTYPAQHALNDQATTDRVAWLVDRLGLEPIGAKILAKVGLPDE